MLDVLQIFGRAGRPQFDDFGEATLLTTSKALPDYLRKLARARRSIRASSIWVLQKSGWNRSKRALGFWRSVL